MSKIKFEVIKTTSGSMVNFNEFTGTQHYENAIWSSHTINVKIEDTSRRKRIELINQCLHGWKPSHDVNTSNSYSNY